MTMPFERVNAVNEARVFMQSLTKRKNVPDNVVQACLQILKHYPTLLDMELASEGDESIFKDTIK